MSQVIYTEQSSGPEVDHIINTMSEVFATEEPVNMVMACLAIAFLTQYPDLTLEELQIGMRGASEWIALYLSNLEDKKNGVERKVN